MSDQEKIPRRPLPSLKEPDTAPFWKATANQKLTYQRCEDCGSLVFYPRAHCTNCGSAALTWHEASGRGTVYTFSVVRQSYHPFFRSKAPYAVAWIDLEEGPRLVSNVIGIDVEELRIGMHVVVDWEAHDELSVPLFRPAP